MDREILHHLAEAGAVLTKRHFVYASGRHGTAYINMREVAHESDWLRWIARGMAYNLRKYEVDVVLGPETLGRTLAGYVALGAGTHQAIWCDFEGEGDAKRAVFSPKLDFGRLVKGKCVAIVDDLLTTGSSIKLAADLVHANGGVPLVGAVVVRRTPDVEAEDCGVDVLEVMADVPGFVTFTSEECAAHGPCSQRVPVVLRPGHGHEWIKDHPGYPTA